MNKINPKKFQKSITEELNTIKDRVRNLVGNAHWGEDGRYKEAILKNVIRRFLPTNLSIGTGFVIRKNNKDEPQVSKQIDIIIYESTIPVLFSEGDFVITTYKNVRGIVEVKTKIRIGELQEIMQKAKENGELIGKDIFNGIFSYEFDGNINSNTIDQALKGAKNCVNHISLGPDMFIRFWKREDRNKLDPPVKNCQNDFYNVYELRNLSFSYFISNLLELTCISELDDRWWFLYPIVGTKERHRMKTVCLKD